ncbi:MAG TPA: aldo/keto reductase [Chloroflexi bacterium]|jgi:aryl-alcohol dehydrogenase-like predicted oxidoreductase|nr:aldo/keto reductase [Chloroflexota bacterium]
MQYRTFGTSGIEASVIAMGCWAFAGDMTWGPQEDQQSIAAVHAALDAGVTFFDTAEGYGDGKSEEVLGRALEGRRDRAVIATKVSAEHLRPSDLRASCEASLRRLRTDVIDLYQIHWPSRTIPLEETVPTLQALRDEGKIRAFGVSNFGGGDLADLLRLTPCTSNQLPYSLLWRAIEFGIRDACVANDIGIIVYSPLEQGLLTGKYASPDEVPAGRARTRFFSSDRPLTRHGESGHEEETFATIGRIRAIADGAGIPMADLALAWLLRQPGVTTVLAGSRSPEQIVQNARAASVELTDDVLASLDAATQPLKEALGPNPDHYQSDSRYR